MSNDRDHEYIRRDAEANRDRLNDDKEKMLQLLSWFDEPIETDYVSRVMHWTKGRPGQIQREFPTYFEIDRACTTGRFKSVIQLHRHLFPFREQYRKPGGKPDLDL